VVRDPGLLHPEDFAQLLDTLFAPAQDRQDAQADRVIQAPEPLGQELEAAELVGLGRYGVLEKLVGHPTPHRRRHSPRILSQFRDLGTFRPGRSIPEQSEHLCSRQLGG
jgi:hypothetical protein